MMASYTPMIQQYLKIKAEHQDAFLFFRLGDFYDHKSHQAEKIKRHLGALPLSSSIAVS